MTETYKLNPFGGVQRLSDGAFVPEDERNSDWRAYQAWIAEGNTPEPADHEPPGTTPEPTVQRLTVITRLAEMRLLAEFCAELDASAREVREVWYATTAFTKDDPLILKLLRDAGADPAVILK
jgi:hypothetical protein